MPKKFRIAIFAGPSGGHLYPALAVAEAFLDANPENEITFVTSEKGRKFVPERFNERFKAIFYLHNFPFPGFFTFRLIPFLIKLCQAIVRTWVIIKQSKPDVCIGFGSYASFPGVLISWWQRIPVIIHEQNYRYGKATKSLINFTNIVTGSFEKTVEDGQKVPYVHVGLPLRRQLLKNALKRRAECSTATDGKVKILVVGGSQGASRINELVLGAFERLSNEEKDKIAVKHITGKNDFLRCQARYKQLNMQFETYDFVNDIENHYSNADVVISRAGSATLFELAAFSLPAIVIPYPHAQAHQNENANFFSERNAIICKDEKSLDETQMKHLILELVADKAKREQLSKSIAGLGRLDASERFVAMTRNLIQESL